MFNLENIINLPLVWGGLIATAVFLYIFLDGFDLGVGILFPFAPSDQCRDRMMNSVAPFWDGNETWLVLGGGGLFAAFPLSYAIIMSALYIPICALLFALIFRGVAFEFRFKAGPKSQLIWDYAFHFGSLFAAFFQGVVLASLILGIEVKGRNYAGGPFDWVTPFAIVAGLAMISGYALLGSSWLIMKTEEITQEWARNISYYIFIFFIFFVGVMSLWTPYIDIPMAQRLYSYPNILYFSFLPFLFGVCTVVFIRGLIDKSEILPFIAMMLMFLLGYMGIIIGLWPHVVPYSVTFKEAAAAPESQSLLLVGALAILPIILAYTAYSYWVFRGKSSHEPHY